jgi:Putative zinc-finger
MDYPAGWTCERTVRQFEAYLLSTLAWLEALAVAEHLEACDGCTQKIVIYRTTYIPDRRG